MHDQPFPPSPESPDDRTRRAIRSLEYEEEAGLGFRRVEREFGVASEHLPGGVVELNESPAALTAAYIAALGLVFAFVAMVYKPLPMGLVAFVCSLVGLAAGGRAETIGRRGMIAAGFAVVIGLGFALYAERPLF